LATRDPAKKPVLQLIHAIRKKLQEDPEKPLMRHDSPKTTYLMGPAGVYTVTNSSYCRYYFLKTVKKNILLKFFLTVLRKNLRRISGP
jgi:hypothetical protein